MSVVKSLARGSLPCESVLLCSWNRSGPVGWRPGNAEALVGLGGLGGLGAALFFTLKGCGMMALHASSP